MSTTLKSVCVTESWRSRASRLRSSTMLSSRLRENSRPFSIAIGMRRQHLEEVLVFVAEVLGPDLVRQVERRNRFALGDNRNAHE